MLPELVQLPVVLKTGRSKPFKEFFLGYFKVFAEPFKARVEVSELHVYPTHEHDRVLWIICHIRVFSVCKDKISFIYL